MNILMTGIKVTKGSLFINIILQFVFTSLYYIFSVIIARITGSVEVALINNGILHIVIVATLCVGIFFLPKINQIKTIYICSTIMLIPFVILLLFPEGPFGLFLVLAEGVFFTICQLLTFTYFWSSTASEERGRIAGFIGFFVMPLSFIMYNIANLVLDIFGLVILSILLLFGALATRFLKAKERQLKTNKEQVASIHEKRTVYLYVIPWIIFSVVNTVLDRNLSDHAFQSFPDDVQILLRLILLIGVACGALAGGVIADIFGRKLSLNFSLTLYGINTAFAGIILSAGIAFETASFMFLLNGLNWGILWTMYGLVIWGDLADKQNSVKRYSLGLIIFYLPLALGILLYNQIFQFPVVWCALIGCSVIFLSNIPLLLAPELRSEEFRDKIRLRLHMNVVKKLDKESRSQR